MEPEKVKHEHVWARRGLVKSMKACGSVEITECLQKDCLAVRLVFWSADTQTETMKVVEPDVSEQ
jgi:hypothetical protein